MLLVAGIAAALMVNWGVLGYGSGAVDYISCARDNAAFTHCIDSDLPADNLGNKRLITKGDMEVLIDHYKRTYPDTALDGCSGAFITASNLTGVDPIFLFSLAGVESGWGTSSAHIRQGNPYSLGMYGDGVHNGYKVGDSFYDGIIVGACYIYENYYLNGQETLELMNHFGDHSYCAGDPSWERQIETEMRYCYKLLGMDIN